MPLDPALRAHKEWLGFLQPVGLVVSPPALVEAQAVINRAVLPLQQTLQALVREEPTSDGLPQAVVTDFPTFAQELLGWEPSDLMGAEDEAPLPPQLELPLPHELLRPTYAVPDPERPGQFLMLVQVVPTGTDLDDSGPAPSGGQGYHASPQLRFERLLQGVGVPIGLLFNGTSLRLVYAPARASSGHLTFPFQAMLEVAGRPILSAFCMLLEADRLFSMPRDRRLPALLSRSREFQNTVSTALADQVFEALSELLRGFQSADRLAEGCLFGDTMANEPEHIYGGLLTVMMRLLFLLYAEDKGLVPAHPVYARYYAVSGLFERLREDAGRYPDTMDLRFGAWATLLTLFRLIYKGGAHGDLQLPAREGELFDPNAYPFLEGRPRLDASMPDLSLADGFEPPRVSDGTIHRILERLLLLDGERLSYRSLDVEHLGSVYEAMMGYALERTGGHAIAVRPNHVVVDLERLLEQPAAQRDKWLKEQADCKIDGKPLEALKRARMVADVVAALGRKVSPRTPNPMTPGTLYLQPGEERRRSGSHYTPRKLTEPIVRTALRPVLERMGANPRPDQVLELKICDPAMGSGAFLVEACRQLAEVLAGAYEFHGLPETLPPDETLVLYARRRVAECCLYGVDKNPFAVGLAKLSLWLETLAKDHPFTFVDHALRCGDSLVGLSREQIRFFHWQQSTVAELPLFPALPQQTQQAAKERKRIQQLSEDQQEQKREALREARHAVERLRLAGDLVIAAFFSNAKDKERESKRRLLRLKLDEVQRGKGNLLELLEVGEELRRGSRPLRPFHWELEFPEVFERENPGFDCVVGNPPFLGGRNLSHVNGATYLDWLIQLHSESSGGADLVAHFFRRAFHLIRKRGSLGLIATNTIAQGDTRSTGLRWICEHGGTIYDARKRVKWPGLAAVVVSVICAVKDIVSTPSQLNGFSVKRITAFLLSTGGNRNPSTLRLNESKSFQGSLLLGMGFTFDDQSDAANPISSMIEVLRRDARNAERIKPFVGGEDVNANPSKIPRRYVIDFGIDSLHEASKWPDLLQILQSKVRPERQGKSKEISEWPWWQFWRSRPELYRAISQQSRVLVATLHSSNLLFDYWPSRSVFSHGLAVFCFDTNSALSVLQCRIHELWSRFAGSSLGDALRYTPSDCFETFPFPPDWEQNENLERAGQIYYEYRAQLMIDHNEGLTATYNRFHDPAEQDEAILELRQLHASMDRVVLDAYGWSDVATDCGFGLDYLELEDDVQLPADVQARVDAGDLFFEDAASAQDFDAAIRSATGSKRKLPWRLRWPEAVHDEVLARLLELNQQRAEQERLAGEAGAPASKRASEGKAGLESSRAVATPTTTPAKARKKGKTEESLPLFAGVKKG